jgi:hypothetical protein
VLSDALSAAAVFSNVRLRGIGFRFRYLTIEQGLEQILGALHEPSVSSHHDRTGDRRSVDDVEV